MSNVRLRRLSADFTNLQQYVRRHPRVKLVTSDGDPPERYQLEYRIRSLRQVGDDLTEVKSHLVEIVLPRNYPRTPPQCRMLSPVFHPNIAPHAICVGDHWSPGEPLQSIVVRIGEMLAYQSYNVKSPLNGEAARWVAENQDQLPLDKVSLLVEESDERAAAPEPKQAVPNPPESPRRAQAPPAPAEPMPQPKAAPVAAPERIAAHCTHCNTKYSVSPHHVGRTVKCKVCEKEFVVEQ
jgi:ubiquitin-protein ligase